MFRRSLTFVTNKESVNCTVSGTARNGLALKLIGFLTRKWAMSLIDSILINYLQAFIEH